LNNSTDALQFSWQFSRANGAGAWRASRAAQSHWLLATALLVLVLLTPTRAEARYASFVMDADSGEVLHSINADTRNYPASLTKMMTLYMMFEALGEGRLRMDDRIMMSRRAANQPPSKLGLKPGRTLSVRDAVLALTVKSANDVAAAVAEHMAGTERQFALLMTAKARSLGMRNTTFRNASGLPNRGQMSTARDMATLARALVIHFPKLYGYFSAPKFTFSGQTYKTHNQLLTNYEGTDGIKTGYIRASGFNLVASVKRGNRRLIGVVFGARNSKSRNRLMVRLLDKGWAKINPTLTVAQAPTPVKARRKSPLKSIWGVQVGAYKSYDPAYKVAVNAVNLAPSYLAQGDVTVVPLEKRNGRVLYRGRVMGISKKQAYRACRYLKSKKLGCMELKGTQPLEIAALNEDSTDASSFAPRY